MTISKILRLTLRRTKNLILRLQRMGCEEILILGDSHSRVFSGVKIRSQFPDYFFNVVVVGGVTVSGLENPNSKTQALPIFMHHLKKSKAKTIVVLLGEVDTGFVIWYRAEKYKTQVTEMFNKALMNYQKFLLPLSKTHRVICVSAPLPTIKDGQDWGEVAKARKDVKASQLDRTNLTIQFNKNMKEFCQKNNISYMDFDEESVGENGLVDAKLLNKNPNDHHYDPCAYAEMLIPKLKRYIEQGAPPAGSCAALNCRR